MPKNFVIIRTARAGVFMGYLESEDESTQCVVLRNARRIWYWAGAASLSQLAVAGTSKPRECRFPAPVKRAKLFEVLEILDGSEAARLNLEAVPEWKA
jgi:hypothetical protein